jgi:pimeloyl-ACP methyl ester carboxylesterase
MGEPWASARVHELAVPGGRVVVRELGAGEPVLLLHGYLGSHRTYSGVARELGGTHRLLALDALGWGTADRPAEADLSLEADARRVALVCEALGLPRLSVVAHDYGGLVALELARTGPARLVRLALINTRAHGAFARPWSAVFHGLVRMARASWGERAFRTLPLERLHVASLARALGPAPVAPDHVSYHTAWMGTPAGARFLRGLYRDFNPGARPALLAAFAGLTCPTAVVWGTPEPYWDDGIAEALVAAKPSTRLRRLPGAGHYAPERAPQAVAAALRELLAEPA